MFQKMQKERNIMMGRGDYIQKEIDLMGFDKIQEFIAYWVQYNYSNISKNVLWASKFKGEDEDEQ